MTNCWDSKEECDDVRRVKTNLRNELLVLRNAEKTSVIQFYQFEE